MWDINIRLNHKEKWLNMILYTVVINHRGEAELFILNKSQSAVEWFMIQINQEAKRSDLGDIKSDSKGFKVIIPKVKNGLFSTFSGFSHSKSYIVQYYKGALEQLQKLSCGHTPATNLDEL